MANVQDEEVKKKYKSYKHWKSKKPKQTEDLVERLDLWMQDIKEWGRLVREDIRNLEDAVHRLEGEEKTPFGKPDRLYGDPGDPPDPPWRPGS